MAAGAIAATATAVVAAVGIEEKRVVVSSRVACGFHCNSSTVAAAAAAAAAAETKRVADVTQGAPETLCHDRLESEGGTVEKRSPVRQLEHEMIRTQACAMTLGFVVGGERAHAHIHTRARPCNNDLRRDPRPAAAAFDHTHTRTRRHHSRAHAPS